jgi:hypothetical protein
MSDSPLRSRYVMAGRIRTAYTSAETMGRRWSYAMVADRAPRAKPALAS